jgi:hypothetical protein
MSTISLDSANCSSDFVILKRRQIYKHELRKILFAHFLEESDGLA